MTRPLDELHSDEDAWPDITGWAEASRHDVDYLHPDSLTWVDLERGHESWLRWLLGADLDGFYGDVRWRGWPEDVAELPDDRTAFFTPPLFLKAEDGGERHRGTIPVSEAWSVAHDFREQLGIGG